MAQSKGKAVRTVDGQRAHACPTRSPASANTVAGASSSTRTAMAAGVAFCIATYLKPGESSGKEVGFVRTAGVIVAVSEAVRFGRFSTSGRYSTAIVW